MKIILSRKGFDSTNGGASSPILPDGRMVSLPIPDKGARKKYDEISWNLGRTMADLIRDLAPPIDRPDFYAHLDPDLDPGAIHRLPGWRAIFGQKGGPQTQLAEKGVGPGDLFLFFGWFRETEWANGKLRFYKKAPDIHALFGWMQVETKIKVEDCRKIDMPWALEHPHFDRPRFSNNWIYVATEQLDIPGFRVGIPGAGLFGKFSLERQLTAPGATRSIWELPAWFHPEGRRSVLSHHGDMERWGWNEDRVRLRTVGRGQEFVLDVDDYPEAIGWIRGLYDS